MKQSNPIGLKRSLGIILILILLALPFFINLESQGHSNNKENFEASYVTLEDHNPDYWKKDGLFGRYIREYELKELRDKNAKHFPTAKGNVAVISAGAIHYLDEHGDWQEIDTRIRASKVNGYAFENTRNGIRTWYPDEKGESIEVGLENEFLSIGSNMTLSWEDEAGKVLKRQSSTFSFPKADSNKVVYQAFFPEVDNEFEIEPDKVKNKLILKKRPAAKGSYLVLSEQLVLPNGWTIKLNEEDVEEVYETKNGFSIVDKLGIPQLYVPAPEVYSLKKERHLQENLPAKWILEQEGQILTLKMQVAQQWLQDPNLQYPVVLDPTLSTTGFKAGFVSSNGHGSPNGYNVARVGKGAGGINRGYIQWNTNSINDASIIYAVSASFGASNMHSHTFDINVNQVAGAYGNHSPANRPQAYEDFATGPTYFTFEYVGGPLTYPTGRGPINLGGHAKNDLKSRLPQNRFQVALSGVGSLGCGNFSTCSYAEFLHTNCLIEVDYCVPFAITRQPVDQTICRGGNASFLVYTRGTQPYQNRHWEYSSDDGATWNDLSDGGSAPKIVGAYTPNLRLFNVPASWENYLFRAGGSNRCSNGMAWSDGARLSFHPLPSVISHPQGGSTCEGGNVSFTASFEVGTDYNWQQSLDGGTTWTELSDNANFVGVTTSTLSIINPPANFNGRRFRLRGYQGCNENFTNSAPLSLTLLPSVASHPNPVNIVNGQNASFTADLNINNIQKWVYTIDGGANWIEVDDISGSNPVSGSTSNTLSLGNVPFNWNGREYALRGFNSSCGPVYTNRALLTVLECELPKATCNNINVELDDNGQATITPEEVYSGPANDCIVEMSLDETTISCAVNSVTLTILDNLGNETSCSAELTLEDGVAPEAKCKYALVELDKDGQAVALASDFDNGSTDACSEVTFSFADGSTEMNIDCDSGSSLDLTLHITDESGNTSTCDQTLFIRDVVAPRVECQDITVELDENGFGEYYNYNLFKEFIDNCDKYTYEEKYYEVGCSDVGTFYSFLLVEDAHFVDATCRAEVTVVDPIAPKAICQDVTVTLDENGQASISVEQVNNGSSDACGIKSMSLDKTIVSCTDNSVTLTVIDNNDNENTCTANLTLLDDIDPVPDVASLPTHTTECSVNVSQAPTATDNCAGTIIGSTNDPLSYSSQGTHVITWIFDDGNGNVVTQTQTVIIKDVTAPVPDVATLPTITGNCEAGLEPPFATDNCEGQILGSTSDPLYFDKEGIYTVTWVYDDGNGNTSSQDQTIVIEDDVAPVPDRNNLPTLRAQCGLTVSTKPTATDRCVGTVVGTTSDPLTYNTQGIHLITWTFDDGNGNVATQTQRVVIRDNKAPVPDQANLPALTGSCSVMITNFPTATDNCVGSVTATTDSPLEFDQEGTFAILWTYDDGNGNTSTQTQWVIVGGDVAPNALCKNISMPMTGNGSVNINAADIDDGSFDDCSSVTLLISPAGGSIFDTGLPPAPSMDLYCKDGKEQNLMLSVTNEKGNTAQCQARVTLEGTDSDSDGLLDSCDNCPDISNLNQKDSNNNGTGDACEENANPDPNPGGWGGWSLKKQGQEDMNIITELKAFPNPFQEEINLSFNLSQEEKTTVEIFNIQGQRVHTLLSEVIPGGEHRVLWDGKDQNGQSMPAGIYLVRLRAGKALINQKVVLQR